MKHPLVSIITPSLNQGVFIGKTLESVFSQDYPNIEYIVMDGGSTDQTIKILRTWDPTSSRKDGLRGAGNKQGTDFKKLNTNVRFIWKSEKDRGQAEAINKGLRLAHGDILCYLNSDDMLEPKAVSKVVEVFQKNTRCMWITGDCRIVNEDGKEIQSFIRMYKKLLRSIPLSIILPVANPVTQPSTFWRKSIVKHIGYFDESLRYVFDYEYWIRLTQNYKPIKISSPLASFRIHARSKGGSEFTKQFQEELSVSNRYFHNPFVKIVHYLHMHIILAIYTMIK